MATVKRPPVRLWLPGERLSARNLNRVVHAVNEDRGVKRPQESDEPESGEKPPDKDNQTDPDQTDLPVAGEVWAFVSRTTRLERFEKESDPAVFVLVEIPITTTVRKPDGTLITFEWE